MRVTLILFEQFVSFIKEREHVRVLKEAGQPQPWTADPILAAHRFCNIQREDDKVTRWVAARWRKPNESDPDVWFAMAVARHINLPETLGPMGYPVPWNPEAFLWAVRMRREYGFSAYNAAYMIRASRGPEWEDKAAYLAKAVLSNLWEKREELRPIAGDTLEAFHTRLQAQFGLGSFMAAQVVADTKYVGPLTAASDWWDFAASGPGSRRGLNRLLGRDVKSPWKEAEWRDELRKLREQLRPRLQLEGLPNLHAQDVQNCLCELDKYMRAYVGEGRPKQRYVREVTVL